MCRALQGSAAGLRDHNQGMGTFRDQFRFIRVIRERIAGFVIVFLSVTECMNLDLSLFIHLGTEGECATGLF